MKLKENRKTYIILFFVLFLCSFLLSIFVEHTSGIHGRGDLLAPGPLTWEEIFKNIKHYIIINLFGVSLFYFIIFYPLWKNKGKKIKGKREIAKDRMNNREKYASLPNKLECRICGYKNESYPWGEDGKSPSYQICPCCGSQFGVDDITPENMQKYFEQWKIDQYKWSNAKLKPKNWTIEYQLKYNWKTPAPTNTTLEIIKSNTRNGVLWAPWNIGGIK